MLTTVRNVNNSQYKADLGEAALSSGVQGCYPLLPDEGAENTSLAKIGLYCTETSGRPSTRPLGQQHSGMS